LKVKNQSLYVSVFLLFFFSIILGPKAWAWETLHEGLWYRALRVSESEATVHLLRVDLKTHRLDILQASDNGAPRQLIKELIGTKPVVAAINASFFDSHGKAMGLLIRRGKEQSPLRRVAWGIFQIISGHPSIIHTRRYKSSSRLEIAIQSGPRLVIGDRIPQFKQEVPARRSGICVTPKKRVILAVASPMPLALNQFAKELKPYCQTALNFDGGASTQFYLKTEKKELMIPGSSPIPNALVVFKK
jgi:uncharacterized protein YigE (DUF2233 family)